MLIGGKGLKVALTTLGCKVNQVETEIMEGLFRKRNYEIVGFDEKADFYIINTCSVTHLGERKSRQLIRRANRLNKDAIIAVTGCYAQIASDDVEKIEGVKVVIGTQDRDKIVDLMEEAQEVSGMINNVKNIMTTREFEDVEMFGKPHRKRAFLKIQDGCCNFCSFCIIPYTRGPIRSRKLSSIKQAVDKLVADGFKEIVLTGIHLGAYGKDFKDENIKLHDAVKICLQNEKLQRLRLSSMESIETSEELIYLLKNEKRLAKHLHLPLQAGSDEILKSMNRHYNTDEFRKLIAHIREEVEDIAISTDLIVGFPGEDEELFNKTMDFVKEMDFSQIHIFPYSKRQGTPASKMENQVAEEEKKIRVKKINAIAEDSSRKFRERFLGKTFDVLFEQKYEEYMVGHTSNYIKTYVKTDENLDGNIKNVKIINVFKDGVLGELV